MILAYSIKLTQRRVAYTCVCGTHGPVNDKSLAENILIISYFPCFVSDYLGYVTSEPNLSFTLAACRPKPRVASRLTPFK